MEPLRDNQYILGSNVPISQVFAILMAVGGALLFAALIVWNYKKYGSFFGAKTGEPLAVLPKYYTAEQRKKMEEARRSKVNAASAAAKAERPEKDKAAQGDDDRED